MSMAEAIRSIGRRLPWMEPPADAAEGPKPLTPAEEAQAIVLIASGKGAIERTSATWVRTASWAANELITAHVALESADGDRAAALRARCKVLRELLAIDERPVAQSLIEDPGPDIP